MDNLSFKGPLINPLAEMWSRVPYKLRSSNTVLTPLRTSIVLKIERNWKKIRITFHDSPGLKWKLLHSYTTHYCSNECGVATL